MSAIHNQEGVAVTSSLSTGRVSMIPKFPSKKVTTQLWTKAEPVLHAALVLAKYLSAFNSTLITVPMRVPIEYIR